MGDASLSTVRGETSLLVLLGALLGPRSADANAAPLPSESLDVVFARHVPLKRMKVQISILLREHVSKELFVFPEPVAPGVT